MGDSVYYTYPKTLLVETVEIDTSKGIVDIKENYAEGKALEACPVAALTTLSAGIFVALLPPLLAVGAADAAATFAGEGEAVKT